MLRWCCALAPAFAVLLLLAGTAQAQITPGEKITLQDTLEKGLKVRTDRERQFIASVVDLVEKQVFSRDLVLAIFQKARFRHRSFPFIYFRTMMQELAKRRKIDLPF